MTMKKKLCRAFDNATPDLMDRVIAACPVSAEKTQDGAFARRTNLLWYRSALSTAAAVVLFLGVCGVAVWMVASGELTPVVDPTQPTSQTEPSTEQTLPPETTEPTESQPTPLPPILGYGGIRYDKQMETGAADLPIIADTFSTYYSNGFILDATGEAFLSLHGGEPTWVEAEICDIQIPYVEGEYRVRFVWCSHEGEVGIISKGVNMRPIPGNDRYVSFSIKKRPYLLDLLTMTFSSPFDAILEDFVGVSVEEYAPDVSSAILSTDDGLHLIQFAEGSMKSLKELTGLKNVASAYYLNELTLAAVQSDRDGYASAVRYRIPEGIVEPLYTESPYGDVISTGDIQHFGGVYLSITEEELMITDCLTGKVTKTGIRCISAAYRCGTDHMLVTAKQREYDAMSVTCLISSNGTVIPLFVNNKLALPKMILEETIPVDPSVNTGHPWYVENPPTMSYEEFFGKTRVQTRSGGNSWTAPTGTDYILKTTENGLQVYQKQGRVFYTVPGFEGPDCGVTPAYCNGNIAYVYSDTQLLRVDIMTGENEVVAEFDRMMGTSGWGPYILRFAAVTGDKLAIYQIYVPTETVELLCSETSAQTLPGWFDFGIQRTTEAPVVWEMVNPKAYAILKQEVGNFDSVLLKNSEIAEDFLQLWMEPEKLDDELQYDGRVADLLRAVQDEFNVNALVRCSYDPITGAYTEKEGVMDSCWFGSGIGHDHFAPEETAFIIPTVIDTKVMPIEGLTPPSAEMAEKMRQEEWGGDSPQYVVHSELYDYPYLCVNENGEYRRVCDVPLKVNYNVKHTVNGSYLVTVEDTVLWVDLGGNVTQIYKAQFGELGCLAYHKGKLGVVDGDHIVMLDLVECTCSVILYHPGSIWMYFDSDNELYIDITLGLDVRAYLFNFENGVLTQSNYRL